jgi:hypothetical protein
LKNLYALFTRVGLYWTWHRKGLARFPNADNRARVTLCSESPVNEFSDTTIATNEARKCT